MCDFLSFLIHDRADKLPIGKRYLFGNLTSHSGTAELHGITYGNPDCWREAEWTGEHERDLVVRSTDSDRSRELRAIVLADFPDRMACFRHAITALPDGLQTLYLRGATVPEGLALPDGLQTLYLSGATVPEGLALPDGLQTLDLSGATVPEGLALPDGLQTLDLRGATVPEGWKWSNEIKVIGVPRVRP